MTNTEKKFYLSKFKGKTFVVKIGGEVIKSKKILTQILADIKELFEFGIKVILVHGGGTQADELSQKLGHTPTKIQGRRVTTSQDLEVCKMLFGGTLNLEIISILKSLGVKGIRVSGLDGGLMEVKVRETKNVDYGHVGDIENVNIEILETLLNQHNLPVVSPIAATSDGNILNINADTIATELAIAVEAEKLILMTNVDGINDKEGKVSFIDVKKAKELISEDVITDGMAVKTNNCIAAIESGVRRVHILNGLSEHSLLKETFTKEGIGTMFVSDEEERTYLQESGQEQRQA